MNKVVLSVGFIILMATLYMYFRAEYVFGPGIETERIKSQILSLMLFELALSTISGKSIILGGEVFEFWKFSLLFIVAAVVFSFIPTSTMQGLLGSTTTKAIGYGVLYSFVLAYREETIFRGHLASLTGPLISSVIFGLFHWGISGYSLPTIGVLIVLLALPAYFITKKIGILGAVGYHFAWNMKALGILDIVIKNMGLIF